MVMYGLQVLEQGDKNYAFPIPRIQHCLDGMVGATIFSKFNMTSAYNQVPVAEEGIPKNAFVTKYRMFEFITIPFWLMTTPTPYQRLMELALAGLQCSLCLIYLDDVIIFAYGFDDHLDHLDQVLTIISMAGLILKPSKCVFFSPEIDFLGHKVTGEGILPDLDNIAKIVHWPRPKMYVMCVAYWTFGTTIRGL